MTILILAVICAVLSFSGACLALLAVRRMQKIEEEKDFTDTEKGQIRQILNMMMFDGNVHEN